MTATWLLPIALIPGTWQAYEIPPTPQITQGEAPSQFESDEAGNVTSAQTQKEAGFAEKSVPEETENLPESKGSTSQEPRQDQAWGLSSSHTSEQQPPQGYWDPSPSVVWVPPEHGYPNPMYSSSSSFHYTQSHYPPGAYFTPLPGYPTPMYGYYQPVDPEQTQETHDPTAYEPNVPPPVVVHTIPLP